MVHVHAGLIAFVNHAWASAAVLDSLSNRTLGVQALARDQAASDPPPGSIDLSRPDLPADVGGAGGLLPLQPSHTAEGFLELPSTIRHLQASTVWQVCVCGGGRVSGLVPWILE